MIQSVRQSVVRVVKDAGTKAQYEVLTETPDGTGWSRGDGLLGSRGDLLSASSRNKAATNATNLLRVAEPGRLSEVGTSASLPGTTRAGGRGAQQSLPSTADYSAREKYFSDRDCLLMKPETLGMYGAPDHMQGLLGRPDLRSPLFISQPRYPEKTKSHAYLLKFAEHLDFGELSQAMDILSLGLKECRQTSVYQFNMGVAFLLSRRYLEAVKVFQVLAKEFPASTSVYCNLLYAYLCDGWVMKVRQARNSKIVRSIRSPLTQQTGCILALIQYAYSHLALVEKPAEGRDRPMSATPDGATQPRSPTPRGSGSEQDLMAEEADDYLAVDQEIRGLVRPTDGLLARHNLISREDLMQNSRRASGRHRSASGRRTDLELEEGDGTPSRESPLY